MVVLRNMQRTVRLESAGGDLGLNLLENSRGRGALVAKTTEGSPAARSCAVFGGDKLLAIDGEDVSNAEYSKVREGRGDTGLRG